MRKGIVRSCRCKFQHGPLGANPLIGRDVDGICGRVMTDSQAQVSNGTGAVLLHEDVFGLQVSVSDTWLSCPNVNIQDRKFYTTLVSSISMSPLISLSSRKRNYSKLCKFPLSGISQVAKNRNQMGKQNVLNCSIIC